MNVRRSPPPRTGKAGGAARTRTGDGGFADLCLATWRRRRQDGGATGARRRPLAVTRQVQPFERGVALTDLAGGRWSGKRDSNPRLRPWQGRTLPLSYSRSPRTLRQRYHRERLRFKALARPAARAASTARQRAAPDAAPAARTQRRGRRSMDAPSAGHGQRSGQPAPNAFRINVTSSASPAPACTVTTSKRHGRADHPACAM